MKAKYDVELLKDKKVFATLSFDTLEHAQIDLNEWIQEAYADKDTSYIYRLTVTFSDEQ